ncbi:hypothetical protein AcW1_006792 [Taiwanofungus camphoratus]|nr:hypothetical protein AcW2_005557 [Antrodia cinnamomea]KAI0953863.1 hypothetical protein AcV7_007274 [Antrodia cinnamomea]KAI0955113.1 hypothetical protein AcW1_006792 [Antrodia cinnamomea]
MIFLSPENTIEIAKEVLHSTFMSCEWDRCKAQLNSWKALEQHLHLHIEREITRNQQPYECHFQKCAGRIHPTADDLTLHVKLSHLSRVYLPCPVQGCSQQFGRYTQIPLHMENGHSEVFNKGSTPLSHLLKPMWTSFHTCIREIPQLPPDAATFLAVMDLPIMRPRRRNETRITSSPLQVIRKGSKMHLRDPEDEEFDSHPLEDIFPSQGLLQTTNFSEYIIRRKPPELRADVPTGQLSRPQPILDHPVREKTPPLSMGYDAFTDKYSVLEKAGLIDGTGEWNTNDEPES